MKVWKREVKSFFKNVSAVSVPQTRSDGHDSEKVRSCQAYLTANIQCARWVPLSVAKALPGTRNPGAGIECGRLC
jgi:hypothetical protein